MKYFAYVRKSSEQKEKQALSIPAQKDKIAEQFPDVDIAFIEEERSAFLPYHRPAFTDMLTRIERGERTGLIAWHPNRLSRNELDAGQLTYMVRGNVIEHLRFCTYHFENTPSGIWMLQMALSQSQYESAQKGHDVKRGLEKLATKGIYPAPAPTGYLNDTQAAHGNKIPFPDPNRFDDVRKMWELMLTGCYTPPQILTIANDVWGFRTVAEKKLSRSALYYIFANPFYFAEFEYPLKSGKWYKGVHEPMVTPQEYDRVQILLGRHGRPRPKTHDFAYRGLLQCGECASMVTAEEKNQLVCSGCRHKFAYAGTHACPQCGLEIEQMHNPLMRRYVYYHCTRKKNPHCRQKSVREERLEEQVAGLLSQIEIPTSFTDWALQSLKAMNNTEAADRDRALSRHRHAYERCLHKIDALIDMRANGEITEEELRRRKAALVQEKHRYEALLQDTGQRVDAWLEIAERGFHFAEHAKTALAHGDVQTKKQIFAALGSNFTLTDKILRICWDNLLCSIKTSATEVNAIHRRFEPRKDGVTQGDIGQRYAQSPRLLRALDDVRTFLQGSIEPLDLHSLPAWLCSAPGGTSYLKKIRTF